jgi:glycosyltransferase involved in cell wall biosynthesis
MISVVIPTYNEERHLGNLLESLAEQDFPEEIEVTIADAISTDRTRDVALRFQSYFHRFQIIDGGMPAVGRNNGAKASSGDPIFFLDADLILPRNDFLKKAVRIFRDKQLAVATTYLKPRSDKLSDKILVGSYNLILLPAKYIRPLGAMCIVASSEAFMKTGGYPENVVMAEDHDFVLNCSKHGPYDILPLSVLFSVRRFEKESRLGVVSKYLKSTYHRIFHGPITKPIFDYEFKYSEEEDKISEKHSLT